MSVDIEEMLARELHDVAHGLQVPPLPSLPREAPRARHRHALLVAAVVLLVVACAIAIEAIGGGSHELDPAPPVPTPGGVETQVRIPTDAPTAPAYVLNRKLYADGRQVPGAWLWLTSGSDTWVAWRDDTTWWWGRGSDELEIEDVHDRAPAVSPNGEYIGAVLGTDVEGDLVGFETRRGGEGLGGVPIDLGAAGRGDPVRVRAVLDDGRIIAQGAAASVLWRPLGDGGTVDLTRTAPGQDIVANTPAGLVVTDGVDGPAYLADISDDGVLLKIRDLPSKDALVSPGTAWFAWTPPGTLGGEVTRIPAINAQTLDESTDVTLNAPVGWDFRVGGWTWEDDEFLVAPVAQDDGPMGERLARCSVRAARCVLISSP